MITTTREPQYQRMLDVHQQEGRSYLGLSAAQTWHDDPKRLLFTLSRYKFVAKMLAGQSRVLEVGCGDGWASRIVAQTVGHLTATDFDPVFIRDAKATASERWPVQYEVWDPLTQVPYPHKFNAAYLLDVLEHIPLQDEGRFLRAVANSVEPGGLLIIGTPSKESQPYASEWSKAGHVNCKGGDELRTALEPYCSQVLMFGMQDEMVHTGFLPMAHYLLAVGIVVAAARTPATPPPGEVRPVQPCDPML